MAALTAARRQEKPTDLVQLREYVKPYLKSHYVAGRALWHNACRWEQRQWHSFQADAAPYSSPIALRTLGAPIVRLGLVGTGGSALADAA
jgi:hypothetical protein